MTNKWSSFGDDQKIMNDWKDYIDGNDINGRGWYGLVREEFKKLALESGDTYLLEEGIWEKAKYYMGKLGSLEKGGKFFGSRKAHKAAREKIQQAMDNASNKAIKQLDSLLRETYPKFPNMETQEDWVAALLNIGAVYDSLVESSEKWNAEDPTKEGALDCKSANVLIKLLRDYTRHQLDYELADIYKHFKESVDNKNGNFLNEQERGTLKHGADSAEDFMARSKRGGKDIAYSKRGKMAGREETESTTIAGLKSNLLPLLLAAGGAASIAGGTLFGSDWFQSMFKTAGSPPEFAKEVTKHMQDTGLFKPDSVTNHVGQIVQDQPYGPDATLDDLMNGINQFQSADGSVQGLDAVSQLASTGDASAFTETFNAAITAADGSSIPGSTPLQNIFGMTQGGLNPELVTQAGGPGMHTNLQIQIPIKIAKIITKSVVKKAAVTGGISAAGGMFAAAGPLLSTLGIGLVASAAAVKLVRIKGMKSSRAQMLNDLLQEMVDVPCEDEPEPEEECLPPRSWNDETPRKCVCPDDLSWDLDKEECIEPLVDPCPDPDECWDEEKQDCVPCKEVDPDKISVLSLIRLDDDGLKFYKSRTTRDGGKRGPQKDMFQKAQDQGITGRGGDPDPEKLSKAFNGVKGRRQPVETMSLAQLAKIVKGKSDKSRPLEAYLTVDASVYQNTVRALKKAGYIKSGVRNKRPPAALKKAIRSTIIQALRRIVGVSKKNPSDSLSKLSTGQAQNIIVRNFKNADLLKPIEKGDEGAKAILDVLSDFGLVRGAVAESRRKPRKSYKKKTIAESRRKPCKSCKKKKVLREAKQPDPWDAIRARMKELSGIK